LYPTSDKQSSLLSYQLIYFSSDYNFRETSGVIVATASLKLNVSYWLARRWLIRTINTIRTSQASTVSATGHIQTRRVRQVWFTWVS